VAAERRIPQSKTLIAQYLALLDPADRADFVDQEASRSHIRILSEDGGSAVWRGLQAQLQAAIDKEFPPLGVHASITGFTGAMVPVIDRLVVEMIIGFFVGFGVIVLVTALIFRSLRIAAISVVPNLIPALACFMVLSGLGITLRVGTVLFLSVSIGGLFNTTIHLAARVRQRLAEGETDPDAVIGHALRKVGPPALFTAVILSLGFSVFVLSRFPDLRVFGILSMTVLLAGFVSDIVVTTVLLRIFYDWPTAEHETAPAPAVAL
ncbi:MAG: MMPL family transporter, partial [Myxococcales bacterium]